MSRGLTLVGFALLAGAAVALQLTAVAGRRTATLAEAARTALASRLGRLVLLSGWLWLGWHVFSRAGPD